MTTTSTERWTRHPAVVGVAACLLAWAVLALAAPDGLDGGDAAVYQQQIERGEFAERTVHLGYFLAMALATGFSDAISDLGMNRLSALFAAGVVGLLAAAAARFAGAGGGPSSLTPNPRASSARASEPWLAGAATTLVLLGSWTFVRQGVFAEVYGAQAFFVVLALFLWWRRRPGAGPAFGIATLVTPSSVLTALGFPVLDPRLRQLTLFAVTAAATLGLALAFVWQDFFIGDRGLFRAAGSAGLDWRTALLKEGFEVVYGAFALLPFLLAGLVALVRDPALRRWALFLVALWLPGFALGERFRDVPVQLPVWALLSLVTVLGVDRIGRWMGDGRRLASLAPLVALALVPIVSVPWLGSRLQSLAALSSGTLIACAAAVLAGALGAAGLRRDARRATRALALGSLVANLLFVAAMVEARRAKVESYKQAVLAIDRHSEPEWIALGGWSRGILLEHYLWSRSYTGRWIHGDWLAGTWGDEDRQRAVEQLDAAIRDGRDVWLLDAEDAALRALLESRGYAVADDLAGADGAADDALSTAGVLRLRPARSRAAAGESS